jgi:hypothetical protein
MSEEVDGITPNGINAFTSSKQGIALALKPALTAGDLERWLKDVRLVDDAPMALLRLQLLIGAARASIIIHSTDKIGNEAEARALDGLRAQWYGAQLWRVYLQYTTIDPN